MKIVIYLLDFVLNNYFPVATTWFLPPSGAALVPPPGHQFQGALPSLACDRFTLRDHRHTPYTHPFHRRSPTHGKTEAIIYIYIYIYIYDIREAIHKGNI